VTLTTSPPPVAAGGPTPDPRTALEQRSALDRRLLDDRERFVTFAFAAADLLVEATADGLVTFAAGAFRSRLGWEPAALVGQPAATVVAAEDRSAEQIETEAVAEVMQSIGVRYGQGWLFGAARELPEA
jgi:hypothetical protein